MFIVLDVLSNCFKYISNMGDFKCFLEKQPILISVIQLKLGGPPFGTNQTEVVKEAIVKWYYVSTFNCIVLPNWLNVLTIKATFLSSTRNAPFCDIIKDPKGSSLYYVRAQGWVVQKMVVLSYLKYVMKMSLLTQVFGWF